MCGGIKYGGVARSSDEYTLLILRISNFDGGGDGGDGGGISSMATRKCNKQYEEDSSAIGDLTAGAN